MNESKSATINRLCDAWLAEATREGGLIIGAATEVYRLHRNGITFHELPYEEIQTCCIALTRVLLLKGLNAVIDFDHKLLWSWLGELLLSRETEFFGDHEREFRQLMEACLRTALAGTRPPPANRQEWEQQRQLEELAEFHTRQLKTHLSLVLVHLSFPLPESMLKKACPKYINESGKVLTDFEVPDRDGGVRTYKVGKRCSRVNHFLFLLYKYVADEALREKLAMLRDHIQRFAPEQDPFDLIGDWRNSSLHGEASFPTIGGTILSIALLVAVNQIKNRYEECKSRVWERVQWEIQTSYSSGHRSPWSFYPPF